MSQEPYYPGLEGVVAGETAISSLTDGLRYRGYLIDELAEGGTFIETAYLLLYGDLPNDEELADFRAILEESAVLEEPIIEFLRNIPLHVKAMDVLRTGISMLSHFDSQVDEESTPANLAKATRLLAQIPLLIAARHRLRLGLPLLDSDPELSFAGNILYLVTGNEPTPLQERALDVSLILYAEHEFNASTFAARVVTSTKSDLYSSVVAAVGALKGPLHGGANEQVLGVLEEIGQPAEAEAWVRAAFAEKRRIMGFGHRIYKDGDPRATILQGYCRKLAEVCGQLPMEETADTIEAVVRAEKHLPPNLDWPTARLYHYLGLDVDLYTPLFVASRVSGWCAHVIEQSENNRLIRPRSRYKGQANRAFVPIDQRGQ
jgi:citrate synthase